MIKVSNLHGDKVGLGLMLGEKRSNGAFGGGHVNEEYE